MPIDTDMAGYIRATIDAARFRTLWQLTGALARLSNRWRYHYRERGFFRINICGLRIVAIDTGKHDACFSDRAHGLRVGRFILRLGREASFHMGRPVQINTNWRGT